jgi:hypothetical protein
MTTHTATLWTLSNAGAVLFQRGRQLLARAEPEPVNAAASAAAEAAAVRALADSYRQSDPGFASDLYAAANRHEAAAEAAAGR